MTPTALLYTIAIILLFAMGAIGPGLLVVRRFPWTAPEKIAASFGLSIVLIGSGAFGVYYALARSADTSYGTIAALGAVAFVFAWKDVRALWDDAEGRAVLKAYICVAAWALGWVCLIRCYSGGGWKEDWYDQYDRVEFFKKHKTLMTDFLGVPLPARAPLLNLFCVPFMRLVAAGFLQYQTLCALLGAGAVFPMYLFAKSVSGKRAVPIAALLAFFLFDPMLVQNLAYPWTKLLCAALTATGVYFYLTGWRTADAWKVRFAFFMLAAGVVTHYSVAPYAAFVALHFIAVSFFIKGDSPFKSPLKEVVFAGVPAAALVGAWIGWCVSVFGWSITLGATYAVERLPNVPLWDYIVIAVKNIVSTLIPFPLRFVDVSVFEEPVPLSHVRETAFLIYQADLWLMFGAGGAVGLIYLLSNLRGKVDRPVLWFWILFCLIGFAGICFHPFHDPYGLAHLTFQTELIVGIGVLAGTWEEWPAIVQLLALLGMLVDFAAGIALHFAFQGRVYGEGTAADAGLFPGLTAPATVSVLSNWDKKLERHFLFLGDAMGNLRWVIIAGLAIGAYTMWRRVLRSAQEGPPAPIRPPLAIASEPMPESDHPAVT